MANFDWRRAPANLYERYAGQGEELVGWREWIALLNELSEYMPRDAGDVERERRCVQAFDTFVRQPTPAAPTARMCRVFVSHKAHRVDCDWAERIAFLANQEGFEYWLDTYDPVLQWVNGLTLPPVVQSILVAAAIEMGLLNCSHVIAVQTQRATTSRWVPYEYGRGKTRMLRSTQAASWFETGVSPVNTVEYLQLGVCADSEVQVVGWLQREWKGCGCRRAALDSRWQPSYNEPKPLPN